MPDDNPSSLSDRELGMHRPITRRDFLNGVAVGVGALGIAGSAQGATTFAQDQPGYYPPTRTGMRGSATTVRTITLMRRSSRISGKPRRSPSMTCT